MRLQADLGDRAGALSTYHRCASVLERELGVVPDDATRRLLARLMSHADRAPRGRPRRHGTSQVGESRFRPAGGQAHELGLLRDRWQTAAAGRPGLVLVRGGAGRRQSRLVAEVAELARPHGAVVASSPVLRHPGRLALAPVADVAAQPDGAVSDGHARPGVAGRGRPAGALRTVGRGHRARARWSTPGSGTGSSRVWPARCCGVGRPTLLVLDNLQWCDEETLAFLTFFLGLAAGRPVLVRRDPARRRSPDDAPTLADWLVRTCGASGLLTETDARRRWRPPTPRGWPRRLADTRSASGDAGLLARGHGWLPALRRRGHAQQAGPQPRQRCRPVTWPRVLRSRLDQARPGRP